MAMKPLVLGLAVGLALPQAGLAQHAELDPLVVQPSGEAYLRATRLRGLDREVAYFDPTRPPPPLETRQSVETARDGINPNASNGLQTGALVAASAIMLLVAYMVITFAGGFSVSFARGPERGDGRRRRQQKGTAEIGPAPMGLDAIVKMSDRRDAIVALCKALLARVVGAEGVLLDGSWTDRETLSRVPHGHPHRDALQELVFASERVQFGGRDVTEDEFIAHVSRLRPLWTAAAT